MNESCSCPIRPNMSYDELVDILRRQEDCKQMYLCRRLDKELRRADKERQQRLQYSKRLKRQGLTSEEIAKMPRRSRQKQTAAPVDVLSELSKPARRKVKA